MENLSIQAYPSEIVIAPPAAAPASFVVRPPGSKSLTNRALVVAALARGRSTLTGVLDSDDTRVMVDSLKRLGVNLHHNVAAATIEIEGAGAKGFPATEADLYVANSGTSLRFLTAACATSKGVYRIDGDARMRERPVGDLLEALNRLGCKAYSDRGDGRPPVTIHANGLSGGFADVKGNVSSQFLSALLMALPYACAPTSIEIAGPLVSKPYVDMTKLVMEAFGVKIGDRGGRRFNIEPSTYVGRPYAIEPDASAASYFFAAAAILGCETTVEGLGKAGIQGDMAFVDVLEHMGCTATRRGNSTTVRGGPLRGVDVDMNAISDTVMTLAVVALFAAGITRIRNVAHIRHKETDRLAALAIELRKLGATVDEHPDGLVIIPPEHVQPTKIHTYNDHRMAMSFAVAGLKVPGITILDPGCVSKTYPGFWSDFAATGCSLTPPVSAWDERRE